MMQDEGNVRITSEIWVAAYRKNLELVRFKREIAEGG